MLLNQLKDIASAVMFAAEAANVEDVLTRIAQVSRDLVKARYAALGIPDGRGGLEYFTTVGLTQEEYDRIDHLPTGRGLLGAIMREQKPIRLAKMRDDPRAVGFCPHHPVMTSFLGVPIRVGAQLFGMLYLCDREDGQPFSQEDEWLIETLAGYAALAIAGTQLSAQQRQLALFEERERISMELHDGVIQSLYALGMQLELFRTSAQLDPDGLKPIISGLNTVIEDIRDYILDLKTKNYERASTTEVLHDLVARLHIPHSLRVSIQAPDTPPPFSPTTFEAICQIANEAISNALRHAQASQIDIVAHQSEHWFEIIIQDNGRGFDLKRAFKNGHGRGLGLRNIQQRARLHGGEVAINTQPGSGTHLTIRIPVQRKTVRTP